MQQELEQIVDLVTVIGAVVATVPVGFSLGALFASVISYKDNKSYYSHTDSTRQQILGKPEFVEFLKEGQRNFINHLLLRELDFSYSMKYFSAY